MLGKTVKGPAPATSHPLIWMTAIGALIAASVTGCGDSATAVADTGLAPLDSAIHGVFVSPATVTIQTGATLTLTASVDHGAAAPNFGVTWSSADTTVAKIDDHGLLAAVMSGATSVTAAAIANPKITGTAKVLVETSASSVRR